MKSIESEIFLGEGSGEGEASLLEGFEQNPKEVAGEESIANPFDQQTEMLKTRALDLENVHSVVERRNEF